MRILTLIFLLIPIFAPVLMAQTRQLPVETVPINNISVEFDTPQYNHECNDSETLLGQEYYFIGTFHSSDAIICTDKNGYQALRFETEQCEKIIKSKSVESLVENGWAICLNNFYLTVSGALSENPIYKELQNKFIVNPPIPIVESKEFSNKNFSIGHFEVAPDAYLLILMSGDFLREIANYHCFDCDTPPLKLSQIKTYYPLVLPLLKKIE